MGKCPPCQENKCEQSYANRSKCRGGDCTCTCQESGIATFWKAAGSIVGGAVCVAGGVGITILTAGFAAPLGGAVIGAGSSLITAPIAKAATGECISGVELLVDVGIGAAVGVLSGGIGAGGSALSKGATGLVKLGIGAGAGAAAGAVGGAVTETARAFQGQEVSLESYGKSMVVGLACGSIGGGSSHLASYVSNGVSSGVAKVATKVVIQAGTATATDAGIQLYETGGDFSKIDVNRLLVTATGQLTVATTAECTSSTILKSNLYNDKLNQMLVEKENHEQTAMQKEAIIERLHEANRLPPEVMKEEMQKAQQCTKLISEKKEKTNLKLRLEMHESNIKKIRTDSNPDLTPLDKQQMEQRYRTDNNVPKRRLKDVHREIKRLDAKRVNVEPSKIGKNNLHFLVEDKVGQIGIDIPDENGNRGSRRIVADYNTENNKFVYADYTEIHDYDGTRNHGENQYHDPYKAQFEDLPANQLYQKRGEPADDDKVKEEHGENQYYDPYKAQFKDLPANQFYQKRDKPNDEKDKEE